MAERFYEQQLNEKQKNMEKLLGKFGRVQPIVGMENPSHYRNKVIAVFDNQNGRLVCGMYAANSHRVLPTTDCFLHDTLLNDTLEAVQEAARFCRYTAFDEDRRTGMLRYAVLRSGFSSREVLVTLVTAGRELPGSKNFVTALRKKAPWVTSVVQNVNPTRTSAVLGNVEKVLYGTGYIKDRLCGLEFTISSRSFYQINPVQTEKLYHIAIDFAGLTGKETVIDAYCGIGTIGLCAAPKAGQVIGVEKNPAAVRDAAPNARRNHISNARFICADATEWMETAARDEMRQNPPDVVFLDPPREGSTPSFIRSVGKIKAKRVVYVSCGPETLARDLELFQKQGYRVERIQPVDMFPMTLHVETVVLMLRI